MNDQERETGEPRSAEQEGEPGRETYDLFISEQEAEKQESEEVDLADELAAEDVVDTQHTDGHTFNPHLATEQGLTYTPPSDPPIVPGEGQEDAQVAAGFAPNMAASDPDVENLPERVDNNDLDLEENVRAALGHNSETGHLTDLQLRVVDGVVYLMGVVPSDTDRGLVEIVINDLDGIEGIRNYLRTAD